MSPRPDRPRRRPDTDKRRPDTDKRRPDSDKRRAEITAEITALLGAGLPLPGSLVQRHNRCARSDCRCRADPAQLHGPYPAWTRKVDGKTITRSLSPEQVARYQPWIDTARRLRELVTELQQLAVEQAETAEGWPRT